MNLKTLIAFLSAAQLATGCVVVGGRNNPPASPGDVTFTWSFVGDTCADYPEIKSVVVEIPGEQLQNGGVFPCTANNYPGITLHDFAPGRYDFRLTAVTYSNQNLFGAEGNFTINGNTRVTVDLTPIGGPSSFAYLSWTFPPNASSPVPDCSVAGVDFVDISIDGAQAVRFNCTAGFNSTVKTPFLASGTHSIEMVAVDSDGYPYYRFSGSLQTRSGDPVYAEYGLQWAVGGAYVRWLISDGPVPYTCGSAGITTMYIHLKDANGNWVYGQNGAMSPCNGEFKDPYLLPGTYRVYIEATGVGGSRYLSNEQVPPTVVVRAGEWPAGALTVDVYRQ